MKIYLSTLAVFSIASLAECWVSPSRVLNVGCSRTTTENRKKTNIALRDVLDGRKQWYAGSSTAESSNTVSQSAVDRKLRNAAERFIKFQSGYFSPFMSNDNDTDMKKMNNMNNGYASNGYKNAASSNDYNNNNAFNNGYNNGSNNQ